MTKIGKAVFCLGLAYGSVCFSTDNNEPQRQKIAIPGRAADFITLEKEAGPIKISQTIIYQKLEESCRGKISTQEFLRGWYEDCAKIYVGKANPLFTFTLNSNFSQEEADRPTQITVPLAYLRTTDSSVLVILANPLNHPDTPDFKDVDVFQKYLTQDAPLHLQFTSCTFTDRQYPSWPVSIPFKFLGFSDSESVLPRLAKQGICTSLSVRDDLPLEIALKNAFNSQKYEEWGALVKKEDFLGTGKRFRDYQLTPKRMLQHGRRVSDSKYESNIIADYMPGLPLTQSAQELDLGYKAARKYFFHLEVALEKNTFPCQPPQFKTIPFSLVTSTENSLYASKKAVDMTLPVRVDLPLAQSLKVLLDVNKESIHREMCRYLVPYGSYVLTGFKARRGLFIPIQDLLSMEGSDTVDWFEELGIQNRLENKQWLQLEFSVQKL
jgi:hypothetical protein